MTTKKEKDDAHCLDSHLFAELLKNSFTNEYYNISFEKQSPNTLIATFQNKETKECYKTNIGLEEKDGKIIVNSQPHLNFQILKTGQYTTFYPTLVSSAEEFIHMLNNELISVTANKPDDNKNPTIVINM